jgi:hypothetical protein
MIFRIVDAEELNNGTNQNKAYLKLVELEKILKIIIKYKIKKLIRILKNKNIVF